MLLRDIQDAYHTNDEAKGPLEPLMRHLGECQRFVFTEHAAAALQQIIAIPKAIFDARAQIFAPFPKTWIEFQSMSRIHGMLWQGDGSDPQRGTMLFTSGGLQGVIAATPFRVDMGAEFPLLRTLETEQQFRDLAKQVGLDKAKQYTSLRCLQMLAAFALIASNGVSHTVEADFSKLNAARKRRGLWPLMSYKEIRLTIDAERAVKTSRSTGTGAMPQHPVRAHLRLLPSGKVTIVRAHMRGDPKNGIRHHHYTVQTSDDRAA